MNIPSSLANMVLPIIEKDLNEKYGFSLDDLNISEMVKKCSVPAHFIHGEEDKFITPDHSQTNYN